MADESKAAAGVIVLAVDGSEFSVGAARVATALAARNGARLVILNVLTSGDDEGVMGLDARALERAEAHAVVDRIADEARRVGIDARAMTRKGANPADAILALADEIGAAMIVVGRRGRRGFARGSLGRTTARVIGAARCPVIVAPRAAQLWTRRIVLAVDGSAASEAAAQGLGRDSAASGPPIVVLSVEVPRHSAGRRAEAARIVERTVAALRAAGREAEGLLRTGSAADEIVRAASDLDADLVVLGSEGRTALGRAMLGSNSQAVVSRVACAVMVVTARMAQRLARSQASASDSSAAGPKRT